MNEADSVFAKEGSLVEVTYIEPALLGCIDVMSMIPKFHGIWTNDMTDDTCYMQFMCYE